MTRTSKDQWVVKLRTNEAADKAHFKVLGKVKTVQAGIDLAKGAIAKMDGCTEAVVRYVSRNVVEQGLTYVHFVGQGGFETVHATDVSHTVQLVNLARYKSTKK